MKVLGIGIKRPAITPPTILTTMVFMMMEFLECLGVMEDMDLGLKWPATISLKITEFIIVVLKVVTTEEMDIFLKTPDTLPLTIVN